MKEKDLIKLYQDCLDFWSIDRQLRMLQEECTELATAISHYLRNRKDGEAHFCEEMADVYLMYNQILFYFGDEKIKPWVETKMNYIKCELEKSKMKSKVVAISGGFDPIHGGHIKLIKEAKKLGDTLIVIVNNDYWLKKKKGYIFMPEDMRMTILKELKDVDGVYLTKHSPTLEDMSVCEALREIRPDVFANGGDRTNDNIPEVATCDELGIKMVFSVGGDKIASSSELVEKQKNNLDYETGMFCIKCGGKNGSHYPGCPFYTDFFEFMQ
jgi:cytidyltransferase-like protein